jgi:hypothetical protein
MNTIQFGLSNDDFLYDRYTAKLYLEDKDFCYMIKVYRNGKVVKFTDNRMLGGEYTEEELPNDVKEVISNYLFR